MKDFDKSYIQQLEQLAQARDGDAILKAIADLHPADIAELIGDMDLDDALFIYQQLSDELAADVLVELDEDQRHDLLSKLSTEDIADALEQMDTDDAVDVIQELDEEDREEVIRHIDDVEQAGDIVDLLQYDEETAGGYMTTEMVVVNENLSMQQCNSAMCEQAGEVDEIYNVYVVDDDNRLKGIFPIKATITNPLAARISEVMEPDPIAVKADTPIDEVARDFEKYDLVAVPVVDSIGRLLGRITIDDIIDQVREQGEKDYKFASGIAGDIDTGDSVLTQVKARLPWLMVGLVGGILNALILDGGESNLLEVLPGMALFIPLIGGTGGNVGTQSSAIVVQGLANGSLDIHHSMRHIFKEVGIAMLNAAIIAGLVFLYTTFSPPDDDVVKAHVTALAVTISLFSVVIFASVFGSLVPIVLEKLKIDPAIATGPFVTVTNDIVGMIIYMAISTYLIRSLTNLVI